MFESVWIIAENRWYLSILFGVYAGMFFIFPRGSNFYDVGSFPTYTLVVCLFLTISQMLDLRKKLGVTIQHLIGSNMEPLLLGCRDSTNVHPKVAKPFSKAEIAHLYCNMQYLGAMKLFLQALQYPLMCWFCSNKCQDARTWVLYWIFACWRLL